VEPFTPVTAAVDDTVTVSPWVKGCDDRHDAPVPSE
jgi:hypothetical protein